jgi:release factor glutamine methyltransferase
MQSVVEVLQKAEKFLSRAGLETPKIDAEWLLADVLDCRRLDLFLQHDKPLEEEVLAIMRERVKRRAAREPLQYILGYSDFHDIRIHVGPGVLIPRPETELLVEKVLDRLKGIEAPRIVDLGTGSGAIALALAKAIPGAKVLAVERSADALVKARENAEALGLREQVAFRSGDWLTGLDFEADCIVSNPPYLTESEWDAAQPEVKAFEPHEALVADAEGMADLQQIVDSAQQCLAKGGLLAFETGIAHGPALMAGAKAAGYIDCLVEKDNDGRDRFFFAVKQ